MKNKHCTLAQASSPLIDWPCLKFQQGQSRANFNTLLGGLNNPEGDQIFKAMSEILGPVGPNISTTTEIFGPGGQNIMGVQISRDSQSEQNCDLSINCSDNLEQFWSLKLCILG